MITQIGIEGFKSFKKVSLKLGHFNLFVGTNASGKSNFFDALRVFQGIGYGFTIDEIFNGKPISANSEFWEAIRGGSAKAQFLGNEEKGKREIDTVIRFSINLRISSQSENIQYTIGISPSRGCLKDEMLYIGRNPVYSSEQINNNPDLPVFTVKYYHHKKGTQPQPDFEKSRPVLHQLPKYQKCRKLDIPLIENVIKALSNMQRIDPSPSVLRGYSSAYSVKRMGERGENFAALAKTIIAEEKSKSAYLSWLQRLTPSELDDVCVLEGAVKDSLFAIKEHGIDYPAPILSDGTLRFAAIAAAFFQPDMPDVLTIEEIENAIHPSRLRLLVELLKSQSINRQVMVTTHSPIVLAWLEEKDYETTFFCKRDEITGESIITPLAEVPQFSEIVKKQPIGDLFAEGWLEGAL